MDLDGDLRQRSSVLTGVVSAEQQLGAHWKDDPYVSRGTAPVAQVVGIQGFVGAIAPVMSASLACTADGVADGF